MSIHSSKLYMYVCVHHTISIHMHTYVMFAFHLCTHSLAHSHTHTHTHAQVVGLLLPNQTFTQMIFWQVLCTYYNCTLHQVQHIVYSLRD